MGDKDYYIEIVEVVGQTVGRVLHRLGPMPLSRARILVGGPISLGLDGRVRIVDSKGKDIDE